MAFNYFDGLWKTMTYGEFLSLVERITFFLTKCGLNKGDRVAIISENRPGWCASYIAILMCGGITVPIDVQLNEEEIKNLLTDSETKIVFYSFKTEPAVLKSVEGSNIKGINLDSLDTGHETVPSIQTISFSALPDDIASIIYTSGTTGKPKGVMLTHQNFCSDADAVINSGLVTHDDNLLSILPLHHTYPFMCTFLVPVFMGAAVTFAPGLKAAELISAIKDNGVTIVIGVPRLFEMIRNGIISKMKEMKSVSGLLLALVRLSGKMRRNLGVNIGKIVFKSIHKNFGRVRFFACGGARLEPSVMAELEALGFTVLEGYGLTETSPIITFNPLKKRKPGSAGKPLPGVEIKIIDDGEIAVKGPMVMKGYYKNPDATHETIKQEWLLTGDTGNIDEEGYLFITGRKKEVIVLSSGKNIYPEEVEKAYLSISLIKEMGIVASEKNGIIDSIHAVIVPDLEYAKQNLIGNVHETLKWRINEVSMKLPEYMRIRGYKLYPEPLPRTPLGKLRRFMLKELMMAAEVSRGYEKTEDRSLMEDEIGSKVVESIRVVLGEEIPVQSSDNLELDIGFDSLKRIEFISALENTFSIELPETFISEIQTVGDVVSRLKELAEGKDLRYKGLISWKDILEKEPPFEDTKKIGFSHGFIEMQVIYILFMLQKFLFKFIFRLKAEGIENIPEKGSFVIAANHASYLDGFVIASAISFKTFKNLYFLGLKKFFTGRIRSLFARLSHVIPIDSETYLSRALQMSSYVLKKERALCIFPEGGRSFSRGIMPFKKGIGVLSLEMNFSVVPTLIQGTFEALPREAKFIKPVRIKVIFGKPVKPSDIEIDKEDKKTDAYQFFADELRQRIIALSENR
jgi:long-chain acyl-CoA synthetase